MKRFEFCRSVGKCYKFMLDEQLDREFFIARENGGALKLRKWRKRQTEDDE